MEDGTYWLQKDVLRSLLLDLPPESNHIASYNHLLRMICDMVKERNRVTATVADLSSVSSAGSPDEGMQVEITFTDVRIEPPRMPGMEDGSGKQWMTPAEARTMGVTYSASVKVSAEMRQYILSKTGEDDNEYEKIPCGNAQVVKGVTLFDIPVMTRSDACTLTRLGPRADATSREERGGMLILQGTSSVIQPQKNPMPGISVVMKGKPKKGSNTRIEWIAEIRSPHPRKARNTSTMSVSITRDVPVEINVHLEYIAHPVPFAVLMKMFGFRTEEEIRWLVWPKGGDDEYHADPGTVREAKRRFENCLTVPQMGWEDEQVYAWMSGRESGVKIDSVRNSILSECLPQMGTGAGQLDWARRALFLGSCVRRLCLTQADPDNCPLDFRDYEGNQYMQMPHELLSIMVRQLYREYCKSLQSLLFRAISRNGSSVARIVRESARRVPERESLGFNLGETLRRPTMTCRIADLLSKGEVVVTKSRGTSTPVQVVNSINPPLCQMAHLARSSVSVNREGKYTTKREMHPSKALVLDPCATPEGQDIGLVESMALGLWVAVGSVVEPVESALWAYVREEESTLITPLEDLVPGCPVSKMEIVFVGGQVIGATTRPRELMTAARLMRRTGSLPRHTAVTWRLDGVHIDCTNGLMMIPLLIADRLSQAEEVARNCKAAGLPIWEMLLQEGCMEYVSTQEAFQTVIAPSYSNLLEERRRIRAGKEPRKRFTHLVPHPSMMLGLASAFEPFLEHNQGPRTTYAANMLSQVIGFGPMSAGARGPAGSMDKSAYRIWYPQRSVCTTLVEDALALPPMGQTMLVAVMDHPRNIEDAVAISKTFCERGGARMTIYKTETVPLRNRNEKFGHPEIEEKREGCQLLGRRANENLECLDADGLPVVGTWVRPGMHLVGRVSAVTVVDQTGMKKKQIHSTSVIYKGSEAAMVDEVAISGRHVKVRLRITRSAEVGDKFTSRYGQKGTVGVVINEEDMPFVISGPDGLHGARPDLIMNPQAFPSRMTIGQLIESACSVGAMLTGERVDGSPWSDAERARKVEAWAEEATKVRMANGKTGEPLQRPVSMGFVQYGRLKHMVADKCHARADGPTQPLTQQPAEGRSKDGGLRIGEMESGVMVSFGGDANFREAQTTRSDPTTIYVCGTCKRQCGTSRRTIDETLRSIEEGQGSAAVGMRCNWCGSGDVRPVGSNYVTALLTQELLAMGMGLKFTVK